MKTARQNTGDQTRLDNIEDNSPVGDNHYNAKALKPKKIWTYRRIINRLQKWVKKHTNIKSVQCCCSFALNSSVEMLVRASSGAASWAGLNVCGNTTTCPVCSQQKGIQRARQVDSVAVPIIEAGGSGVMLTLTVPHLIKDDLKTQVQNLNKCWDRLMRGKFGKKCGQYNKNNKTIWVRSWDWTTGQNGNHSHLHNLIMFERQPTQAELIELEIFAWENWARIVESVFKREASIKAFKMEEVSNVKGVSAYNNKISSFAFEIACGGSIDTSSAKTSFNIWELIWAIEEEQDEEKKKILLRKFRMFEKQTKKLRTISFSKTFRERIVEDEELKKEDEEKKVVLRIREDLWKLVVKREHTSSLLELYEAVASGDEAAKPIFESVESLTSKYSEETKFIDEESMEKEWDGIAFRISAWMFYKNKPEFYNSQHSILVPS
jgi:hypothetical protein